MCPNLCRLCAKESVDKNALKLFEGSQWTLLTQLKCVTGVMLKNSSGMPKLICSSCTKSLKEAYLFRENVLRAQAVLKLKLPTTDQKKQHNSTAIEATEFVQVCYAEDRNYQSTPDIHNVEEREININDSQSTDKKEETISVNYTSEINALDISSNDDNDDTREDEKITDRDNANVNDEYFKNIWFENDDRKYISDVSSEFDKADEKFNTNAKGNDHNGMSRNTTVKTSSTKIKPPKRQRGAEEHSNVFICDQCGNHFTCRHHFQLHLRRHAGDKQCACELCPDKFFTSSELRRHMRKHTGERPFACKFCERRFTDYSTRIKHERTHTNERPFVCTQCSKSFTTSYILKNHMLTHTGERHFRCDVCDKAFTRRTHLVVHFRSIMHKQAVEKEKLSNLTAETQVKELSQPYLFSGT